MTAPKPDNNLKPETDGLLFIGGLCAIIGLYLVGTPVLFLLGKAVIPVAIGMVLALGGTIALWHVCCKELGALPTYRDAKPKDPP